MQCFRRWIIEFIKKIFPKETSFDNFTDIQIQKLEDTINNIPRESLKGKTPYNKLKQLYPEIIDNAHNVYLHTLVSSGLLGLIPYLILCLSK